MSRGRGRSGTATDTHAAAAWEFAVRGVVNSDRHERGRRRITPVFGRPASGGRSRYPLLGWQPGACSHLGAPIGRAINAAQVSAKLV